MAQCFSCQKKLGVFERVVKYGRERLPYCVPCAKTLEKKEAMDFLFEGAEPKRLFRIPNVFFTDTYDVQMKTRILGDLLFLDKGVFFVQTGQYESSSDTAIFWFGIIGVLLGNVREKRARKKAIEQAEMIQHTFATNNLKEIFERSLRVMFFPKTSISELKYSIWVGGIKIKTDEKKQVFNLVNGKKTFREYEDNIREYQYR